MKTLLTKNAQIYLSAALLCSLGYGLYCLFKNTKPELTFDIKGKNLEKIFEKIRKDADKVGISITGTKEGLLCLEHRRKL